MKEYAARTDGILNARMTFDKETLRPTYQMVIGEAGESCAFYIADRLGMPNDMLRVATLAAYGENAVDSYHFRNAESIDASHPHVKLQMAKKPKHAPELSTKFAIGDSVMLYPDDYDFFILFDSIENRKKRHDMQRKYTDDIIETDS